MTSSQTRKVWPVIAAVLLCFPVGCHGDAPAAPDYDEHVQGYMIVDGVPGVSIAIIKEFRIASVDVYGVKDVTSQKRVTPQTLYQAASIS